MAADSFELDPTEDLSAVTVGEPGARQFFLHARAAERDLTLACEKAHVQSLVGRIRQLLAEQEVTGPEADPETPSTQPDFQAAPAWRVAELGLGYHESRKLYVVVAREDTGDEEREGAVARLWVTAEQLRAFARRADKVLSAGRPVCSRCGLPIDPAGHPCPAANGSRPIL
jgi:uncharacterized repeat protein (TIGR03847 family)